MRKLPGAAADDKFGLIVEIEGNQAVVLTPSGDFRRVPLDRPGRQVGDEMPLPLVASRRLRLVLPPYVTAFAAAAVVLFAVMVPRLISPAAVSQKGERMEARVPKPAVQAAGVDAAASAVRPKPVPSAILAYVTVDINPSLEFGVGEQGRVVTARALNEDAAQILTDLVYQGRLLDDVLADVAAVSLKKGYLDPAKENAIVIAAVPAEPKNSLASDIQQRVKKGRERAKEILVAANVPAAVAAINADRAEVRDQAEEMRLSVGKFLVYMTAKGKGVEREPDHVRRERIASVIHEAGLREDDLDEEVASWLAKKDSEGPKSYRDKDKPLQGHGNESLSDEHSSQLDTSGMGKQGRGFGNLITSPSEEDRDRDRSAASAKKETKGVELGPRLPGPESRGGDNVHDDRRTVTGDQERAKEAGGRRDDSQDAAKREQPVYEGREKKVKTGDGSREEAQDKGRDEGKMFPRSEPTPEKGKDKDKKADDKAKDD